MIKILFLQKRASSEYSYSSADVVLSMIKILFLQKRASSEYSYSSADVVLSMIKILFLQKLEVFFGFVYLFAVYKHWSV